LPEVCGFVRSDVGGGSVEFTRNEMMCIEFWRILEWGSICGEVVFRLMRAQLGVGRFL
jgi:hypothetical protein